MVGMINYVQLKRTQLIYHKRFASDLSIFYYHSSSQWTFSGVCECECVMDHFKKVLKDSRIKAHNFFLEFPATGRNINKYALQELLGVP